jgi:hypothetical protein
MISTPLSKNAKNREKKCFHSISAHVLEDYNMEERLNDSEILSTESNEAIGVHCSVSYFKNIYSGMNLGISEYKIILLLFLSNHFHFLSKNCMFNNDIENKSMVIENQDMEENDTITFNEVLDMNEDNPNLKLDMEKPATTPGMYLVPPSRRGSTGK